MQNLEMPVQIQFWICYRNVESKWAWSFTFGPISTVTSLLTPHCSSPLCLVNELYWLNVWGLSWSDNLPTSFCLPVWYLGEAFKGFYRWFFACYIFRFWFLCTVFICVRSYLIAPVIPKLFNFLLLHRALTTYYLQMTYKPVVPLSVYLSEKCKSESIIGENQVFVLCSSQQLIGNLKLPRAYREETWKRKVRTVWKEKAYNLVCNIQTDGHFKCEKERNSVSLLQLEKHVVQGPHWLKFFSLHVSWLNRQRFEWGCSVRMWFLEHLFCKADWWSKCFSKVIE